MAIKPKNWKWDNFLPHEVLSPSGLNMLRRNNLKLQGFALDKLEDFRTCLGVPIYINHAGLRYRGYRSSLENHRINGVNDSPHCQGIAFDINAKGLDEFTLFFHALAFGEFKGIGIYPKSHFVHIDCRTMLDGQIVVWTEYQRAVVFGKKKLRILKKIVKQNRINRIKKVKTYIAKELDIYEHVKNYI